MEWVLVIGVVIPLFVGGVLVYGADFLEKRRATETVRSRAMNRDCPMHDLIVDRTIRSANR